MVLYNFKERNNKVKLSSRELALKVIDNTNVSEQNRLQQWLAELLAIKNSPICDYQKAKKAIALTRQHKVIFPVIRSLSKLVKKHLWDNRTQKGRLGMIGAGIGITFFGGQSAGIAALGGAIGLPLWIVLGAGGAFAGVMLEELKYKKDSSALDIITSYKIVDED
ncbi:MAG: hypothetical protein R3E13_05515 [Alphaproteobacteria bacterium]